MTSNMVGTMFCESETEVQFDPNKYLINYNEKCAIDAPAMFRDSVIQQTISCLIGKFKSNVILTGMAGVGKTKIVEEISRRIACDDLRIPDQLKGYTIWELPLSNIVSGSGLLGDVERKTKEIIEYASNPENKAILFIDEIHTLVGGQQSYDKIAQIMKPALARGGMKVIGATTLQEAQNLLNDPAFNRRFSRLIVDEISQEQTELLLTQLSIGMFNHYKHKIAINNKIIKEIVQIADEYKSAGAHRPDNAITLLDRAMADAFVCRKLMEANVILQNDTEAIATLQATPVVNLSKSQLKKTAMKLLTGNNEKTTTDMNVLKNNMSCIKGQDQVVEFLLDAIERDNLDLYPRKKPMTLLFAGNSGVGKSELAKILANTITGLNPIILNMTEYNSSAAINRIIGAPTGYIGSDSKAELPFDILESNPYQVILLDEFEKCDKAIQRLFMSAFDEGYIKTSKGKVIDFSKAIIIATTNAGYTTAAARIGFALDAQNEVSATIVDLTEFFDVELLNRFTKILNFKPITEPLFNEILKDTYKRDVKYIKEAQPDYAFLDDELSKEMVDQLHKENYVKEFGARPIKRIVQKYIENEVMQKKCKLKGA